jgi:hypothetical protein
VYLCGETTIDGKESVGIYVGSAAVKAHAVVGNLCAEVLDALCVKALCAAVDNNGVGIEE